MMNRDQGWAWSGGSTVAVPEPDRLAQAESLRALGRVDEARAAYIDAIGTLAPRLARALAGLAQTFTQEGRMNEARGPLERAVFIDPSRPEYWDQLGGVYEWAEEYAGATQCWKRVIELSRDDRARPHLGLGWALQQTGRMDEAKAEFQRAAEIEPGITEPLISLGLLEMERARFTESEAAFRAALALRPNCELAYYWLANLFGARLPDADLEAIRSLVEDPRTSEEHRARLLFALGQVLDGRGQPELAAPRFRAANALQLKRLRVSRPFEPANHTRFIDGLIHAFDGRFFERMAGAGLDTRRPVFVIGLPRSGTTLVEQILASHPAVHGAGELLYGCRTFEALPNLLGRPLLPSDCVSLLTPEIIRHLAGEHLERLRALAGDQPERVVDKLPDNYYYIGLLTTLFPHATVIYCRRDLRDVALSCYIADFRSVPWASHPAHIACVCREHLRLMDHWRNVLRVPIHEVHYEEIVTNFEGVARRLVSAVGLDWDPACIDFHQTARPVHTGSRMQVRQPIHTRSVARWKPYAQELPELFESLPVPSGQAATTVA
jgi:tetratricopeptide (TPR) repeat protein